MVPLQVKKCGFVQLDLINLDRQRINASPGKEHHFSSGTVVRFMNFEFFKEIIWIV